MSIIHPLPCKPNKNKLAGVNSRFASVSESEILKIQDDAVPVNTKKAKKFGMNVFRGKRRLYILQTSVLPFIMHQSIPAVSMPPSGQPRGICSRCQPGGGAFPNFFAARVLGISVPQGDPRAFDRRVFERWMSSLGRTRLLSKPKLLAEGKQVH